MENPSRPRFNPSDWTKIKSTIQLEEGIKNDAEKRSEKILEIVQNYYD